MFPMRLFMSGVLVCLLLSMVPVVSTAGPAAPAVQAGPYETAPDGFGRVGALPLSSGNSLLRSAVIDPQGRYAYFGTETSPGRVVKVDLATFAQVGVLTLNTGENDLVAAVMDPAGEYAYFGTYTSPGQIVRIRLSDFTRLDALTLQTGESNIHSAVLDAVSGYAYLGTSTVPGRVVKIDLSTFTRAGALTLNAGEDRAICAVLAPGGGYAYFGTYTSPGRVVQIDLATFTRTGALSLNSGENQLVSAVADPHGYAYFGTATVPGRVVKVDLGSLTRVGTLPLEVGENHIRSSAVDPAGNYGYFGTYNIPGRVVKVDLDNFSRAGGLVLDTGEDSLYSAVLDPAAGYAYFGTLTSPGIVVKIDIAAPDLALDKQVCPAAALPGQPITYTLAFSRAGSGVAAGVRITDVLPLELANVQVISSGAAITPVAGTRYAWQIQDLPYQGAGGIITISGILTRCLSAGSVMTNTAIITATEEARPGDNRGAVIVQVLNAPPLAVGDVYTTSEDTVLSVPAPGIFTNDDDANCDPLSATLTVLPGHGVAQLYADGALVYTPTLNENGSDAFTYTATDGDLTATAVVSLVVLAVNDPPVATGDIYSLTEDVPLVVAAPGVLANDTDIENDPLTATLVVSPAHGTAGLSADGALVYTPTANWTGNDPLVYAASDGNLSTTAVVTLAIGAVNDPPVAADDAYATPEDVPLVVIAPGVLENDVDWDADPLTASLSGPPANGILAFESSGAFVYTPTADWNGVDSFAYIVSDGELTSTAIVVITVTAVNDAPLAYPDVYAGSMDAPLMVEAPGVLGNDIDPEQDPLTAVLDGLPVSGTLGLNDDGSFVYVPPAGFSGTITFTYRADDGLGLSNLAAVMLQIGVTNGPPVAVAGPDQLVETASPVTLDGRESYDPEGQYPLLYRWEQIAGPPVSFAHTLSVTTFLAPPAAADLLFTLVVTDSQGLPCTAPDQVIVLVRAQVLRIFLPLVLRDAP